jgi:hypothetical protein
MIALMEQGARVPVRLLDAVVGGDAAAALATARSLRASGWRVTLSQRAGTELVAEAERTGAAEALLARADAPAVRLDRAGEPALPLQDPVPYPPSSTWAERQTDAPSLGGERP